MATKQEFVYTVVTNIPSNFHAADLRAHFSSFVESSSFVCFHFRHRPEKSGENRLKIDKSDVKRCCVVKVVKTKCGQFLRCNGQHWTDLNSDYVAEKCHVSRIKLKTSGGGKDEPEAVDEEKLLQMPELKPPELMPQGNIGTPTLTFLDLIQRCLLPHSIINKLHLTFPQTSAKRLYGNVDFDYGTKDSDVSENDTQSARQRDENLAESHNTEGDKPHSPSMGTHAQELIGNYLIMDTGSTSSCIENRSGFHQTDSRELKTDIAAISETKDSCAMPYLFPRVSSDENASQPSCPSEPPKASADDIFLTSTSLLGKGKMVRVRKKLMKIERRNRRKLMAENIEEKLIAIEKQYQNDDDAEEWDRCLASEDDPSNQERNKERLFEEEIDQPWEKGGPGVVFYTDAMYWQEKEGDFDEQTTDDLDVDFSPYEEGGTGDKDMVDFLRIRQERRFRDGYDSTDRFSIGVGKKLPHSAISTNTSTRTAVSASHYPRGFARKVMERQGWKEGQALGRSRPGIVEPLTGEGQSPYNKRGLGYTDPKPTVYQPRPKNARTEPHLITTVYDDPKTTDPKEPLLQRNEPSALKHRQSHFDKFK